MHGLRSLGIVLFYFYFFHYNQTNSKHFIKYTAIPNVLPGIVFKILFFFFLQSDKTWNYVFVMQGVLLHTNVVKSCEPLVLAWRCLQAFGIDTTTEQDPHTVGL